MGVLGWLGLDQLRLYERSLLFDTQELKKGAL